MTLCRHALSATVRFGSFFAALSSADLRCAALCVTALTSVVGCGRHVPQGNGQPPPPGLVIRWEGQTLMQWPAEGSPLGGVALRQVSGLQLDRESDGVFVTGSPARLSQGPARGRTLEAGPWGRSGLLDLPQILLPRRCSAKKEWLRLASRISSLESDLEIPRSALTLEGLWDKGASAQEEAPGDGRCRDVFVMDCLRTVFEALPRVTEASTRPSQILHPMFEHAEILGGCFRPSVVVESPGGSAGFEFSDGRIVFFPERLFSILIFPGVQDSLARALEEGAPVAVVPLPERCETGTPSLGCLVSPLPLSACRGCQDLQPGKSYSVFLVKRPGILDEQILPVVIKMPEHVFPR